MSFKRVSSMVLMTMALVLCCSISVFAATTEYDISANQDGSVMAVFDDATGVLTISGSGATKNYSWGSSPFRSFMSSVSEIQVEEGVTTIGNYLFFDGATSTGNPSSVESVTLPSTLTSIGQQALTKASSLKTFVCPADVELGENALWDTSYSSSGNPGNGAASGKTATVHANDVFLKESLEAWGYTVSTVGTQTDDRFETYPNSLTFEIGANGDNVIGYVNPFTGEMDIKGSGATKDYTANTSPMSKKFLDYVTDVSIDDDITYLGNHLFYYTYNGNEYDLSSVTSITLPSKLTGIGSYVFYNAGFTSIEIPAGVTSIGERAFYDNTSLKTVVFESGSQLETIGSYAFFKTALTALDLPDTVTTISNHAFAYTSIETLVIPASVETIGNSAFQSVMTLTDLSFEDGSNLKSIGSAAFKEAKITNLEIPEGTTTIGGSAFNECRDLERIIIPASVTSIGDQAFYYYGYNAADVVLKNYGGENQTIGAYAFYTNKANTTVYQYSTNTAMTEAIAVAPADPVAVYYLDNEPDLSGDLDNGIHWEYDPDTKTLTFTGNGDIPSYEDGSQPWYGAAVQYGGIDTYKFGDGITSIGDGVFGSYGNSAYGSNGSGASAYGPAGLGYGGATYVGTVSGSGGGGDSTGGTEGGSGDNTGDGSGDGSGSTDTDTGDDTASEKEQEAMIIVDAEPTLFKVTVPIVVEVSMDRRGNIDTGDGYYVENLCAMGPVVITDIHVNTVPEWKLVDWNTDFTNMKASSYNFALTINDVEVDTDGSVVMNDSLSSVIRNKERKDLSFGAKLGAQRKSLNENIAAVVFTVDFDKV